MPFCFLPLRKKIVRHGLLLPLALLFIYPSMGFAASTVLDPLAANNAQNLPASTPSAATKTEVPQKILVSSVQGEVFIRKAGGFLYDRISGDAEVHEGDSIKTGSGTCVLVMENHTNLTLQPGTILEINEATFDRLSQSRATVLKLNVGRLKAKIGKLVGGSKFEVLTPTALAAVRGTIFYLDAGTALGKLFTELYVDESSGGVLFRNTGTGAEFLIPNFNASSAFQDGSLLAPRSLSESERKEFVDQWESAVNQVLGQQSVEEKSTGASESSTTEDSSDTSDADQDKLSEQNISGSALTDFIRRLLEALSQQTDTEWTFDAVKYDEGTSPLSSGDPEDGSTLEKPSGPGDLGIVSEAREDAITTDKLEALRDEERSQIREEIRHEVDRIKSDINFQFSIAQLEETLDAQTGKVFTDAHGNRVRVDQYIFKPTGNSVEILSLTLRSVDGSSQISSAAFGIDFNREITEPLKDLPWSDYFNVVTREEMAKKLNITDTASDEYNALSEQYVVHEKNPSLALGAEGNTALYPEHFYVEFSNPNRGEGSAEVRDRVRFDEVYGAPEDTAPFIVQPRTADSSRISSANGDAITVIHRGNNVDPELYINGKLDYQQGTTESPANLTVLTDQDGTEIGQRISSFELKSTNGSQTPGFVADFNQPVPLNGVKDVNYYKDSTLNQGNDTSLYNFPAFFIDRFRFNYYDQYDEFQSVNKALVGFFVPIDNQGHVLRSDAADGSGFRVHGLRDLLSPNPHVNGGNYNLEVILSFGDVVEDGNTNTFEQNFVIDTIVTPEILNGTGAFNTMNRSDEFPASIEDKTDHKKEDSWETVPRLT